jgi:ATP-binding cassette subfamily F protein 3
LFGIDFDLDAGEVVAIIGANGAGKSTFLKTILGQLEPRTGELILGASLHIGYFAQAHEGLNPENSVLDEILGASPGMLPYQGRDYLGKYLFSGDDVFKTVSMLSGGERGRLALAKLALQDTNLLLLDEPTNHLDIPSQEVLQSVLDGYQGTILLVTHDRYLVDALATQIWEIDPEGSHLTVFKGTYSQMKEEKEKEAARALAQASTALQARSNSASRIPQADPRRIRNAKTRDERRKMAETQELENKIAALELELANLSAALENPPADAGEVTRLGKEYTRVQEEMDEQLAMWERLAR